MNTKRNILLSAFAFAALSFTSCNEFLDVMPDNRTEVDTEDKVNDLLTSAYCDYPYIGVGEYSSDNVDRSYIANPMNVQYIKELACWQENITTGQSNDDPQMVWQGCYTAINTANIALESIAELEAKGELSESMQAARAEALMCRAFGHFILVNIFCQAYAPGYAEIDLGIPYMTHVESTLNPKYERGTVAEVYAGMERDIEAALPYISNINLSVPKYHFNVSAAYAFAARFYLFYQKWDKAIECADMVLGDDPKMKMRDLEFNKTFGFTFSDNTPLATLDYIDSSKDCNLLMQTGMSQLGIAFGPYGMYTEYTHGSWMASTETITAATAPWGKKSSGDLNLLNTALTDADMDKALVFRIPYLFEYSDPVAGTGYPRVVYPVLTVDETLLIRAEANIMSKNYSDALSDLNIWVDNFLVDPFYLTTTVINNWVKSTPLYTPTEPTCIKEFEEPTMEIQAGLQQNMMYFIAYARRIETLNLGLRFFDIKRFGIRVHRRQLASAKKFGSVTDELAPRDLRCALQIPNNAVLAGFEANPR